MGHHLEAMWVPGHSNFEPNEGADRVAKEAAEESSRVRYPAERREVVVKLVEKVKQNLSGVGFELLTTRTPVRRSTH